MAHAETDIPALVAASLISASCASERRTRRYTVFLSAILLLGRPARLFVSMSPKVPQKIAKLKLFSILTMGFNGAH